jgi:hypothetical protein
MVDFGRDPYLCHVAEFRGNVATNFGGHIGL